MLQRIGIARLIISIFLAGLLLGAYYLGLPMGQLGGSMLTRFGMNLLLVLAMIPTTQSGSGPNFGLPFGIICGLIAMTLAIEFEFAGFSALFFSIAVAIPLGLMTGYLYGQLLNRVKGQEMTVGTYIGFSIVSLMCIFWLISPYKSPEMVWPYAAEGLRVTIVLDGRMDQLLDKLWAFQIGTLKVPTGLLLASALFCIMLWYFMRSRTGLGMMICGANPRFALSSGLNVNRYRLIGAIISSIMGAVGIIIYSQSYGFVQLYQAPLYMGLISVSAILIGG
ncbi:MAG: ABC transporter permease, partial [Synergistaceae bacterium]|nr:ABC transporter permease [Synergistaceae bacterium]